MGHPDLQDFFDNSELDEIHLENVSFRCYGLLLLLMALIPICNSLSNLLV